MNKNLRDEINRLHAQVCSALADPNRILILYKLSEHPHNVSDLAAELELHQPTTSRHLKVLRDRGIVVAQRDGQSMFYSLLFLFNSAPKFYKLTQIGLICT